MHISARSNREKIRASLRNPAPFQGQPGEFVRTKNGDFGGRGGVGVEGFLGTNAKSSTPPPRKSASDAAKAATARAERRAERFELQAYARELLYAEGRVRGLQYPANHHQTCKCLFTPFDQRVHVHRSVEHGSAFYGGLVVCGRPGCPPCAAKIAERRRAEIAQGFDWAHSNGKKIVMVTFTHPHRSSQPLAEQLSQQADAFRRLRAGAPWQRILPAGYVGLIRSLEVTHGANGWHPHTHEAWVVDRGADVSGLRAALTRRWLRMLIRSGLVTLPSEPAARWRALRAFYRHSVDVLDNARSSDYLAKGDQDSRGSWGADSELARSSSKMGRKAGRSVFQLLADYRDGSPVAGQRYVEFVEAMRGKAPIFWSRGLKTRVGVDDLTDEALAERQDDLAVLLGLLELDDWRLVRAAGYRAHLLRAAETGGWAAVQGLLAELRGRKKPLPDELEHRAPDTAAATRPAARPAAQPAPAHERLHRVAFADARPALPLYGPLPEISGSRPDPSVTEKPDAQRLAITALSAAAPPHVALRGRSRIR